LRTGGPGDLVAAVHGIWDQLGLDRLATAAFARIDATTGQLRIACAGHPPPLIVEPDRSWFPSIEPAPPFGAPPGRGAELTTTLPPGAALVFYTDGLVESRDRDIDEGSAMLIEVTAGAADYDAGVLADRIVAAMTTEDRSDDVALMVVRRRPAGAAPADLERTSVVATFDPEPSRAGLARRFVVKAVQQWDLAAVVDDAQLCVAELASNAILHSRGPFTVGVRRTPAGIRIDVHDDRPDRLPVLIPSLLEPLDTGTTGRGLQLIGGLADRWGYFTTPVAKTVWIELSGREPITPSEPIIELADRAPEAADVVVRVIELPVRAAIASGVQVDEVVRELQLQPERLAEADRTRFYDLLEGSARPRLTGRQEAFRAAAEGLDRYSCELATTAAELAALAEFGELLARLAVESDLDAGDVSAEVAGMRDWLSRETASQLAGNLPSAYGAEPG
jgi:anti-sigma regulatory factor (Ser/Thr protein kinase)